jgi:hypothetical protein
MLRLTLQELNKLCVCFRRLFIVSFKKILTVEIPKWWKCTILHLIASASDDIVSSLIVRYPGEPRHKLQNADCPVVPKGCQP